MSDPTGGGRPPAAPPSDPGTRWPVYAVTVIAWLGFLVHNVADLPGQTFLSPETLWPSLITGALLALYALGPRRIAAIGLFLWTPLNFLGALVTVLPLPLLPFDPEQSWRHYSFHVLYAVTQVPLLVVSGRLALGRPASAVGTG